MKYISQWDLNLKISFFVEENVEEKSINQFNLQIYV